MFVLKTIFLHYAAKIYFISPKKSNRVYKAAVSFNENYQLIRKTTQESFCL